MYIAAAKKTLVGEKILDKVVLNQRLSVSDAFDRKAREWRWMAASAFINKKGV